MHLHTLVQLLSVLLLFRSKLFHYLFLLNQLRPQK
nr:MAG TPA: hypothetical protein [Caudoviricetes sp.]